MARRAEHAVAADRFAHEIVGFLAVCAARLRRLNGNPLGAGHQCLCPLNMCLCVLTANARYQARRFVKYVARLRQQHH
jgi:hypothetical protein